MLARNRAGITIEVDDMVTGDMMSCTKTAEGLDSIRSNGFWANNRRTIGGHEAAVRCECSRHRLNINAFVVDNAAEAA